MALLIVHSLQFAPMRIKEKVEKEKTTALTAN